MAASAEEPVLAGSILERAKKDAETLDWLSIPADQCILDDKSLERVADVPGLFGTDDELECEEKENMKPEPKRSLASSLALILQSIHELNVFTDHCVFACVFGGTYPFEQLASSGLPVRSTKRLLFTLVFQFCMLWLRLHVLFFLAVTIQWTGLLDWTTWTGPLDSRKLPLGGERNTNAQS